MAFSTKLGNILRQTVGSHIKSELSPSIYQAIRCMSSSKLFIGGLSYGTDDQSLREAFSGYGEVVEARVILDRETGRSRGFGFVTYTSSEEAGAAITGMDGKDLHGRMVRVNYATERSGGGFRGGYGGGGGGYGGGGGGYGGGYGGSGGGYSGSYGGGSGGVGNYGGGSTGNFGGDAFGGGSNSNAGNFGVAGGSGGSMDGYGSGGGGYGSSSSSVGNFGVAGGIDSNNSGSKTDSNFDQDEVDDYEPGMAYERDVVDDLVDGYDKYADKRRR